MRLSTMRAWVGFGVVCGVGAAADAQVGTMRLERDLFPPMGATLPLYESDLLVRSSAEGFGLRGPVRMVALRIEELVGGGDPEDFDEVTMFLYGRDGMLLSMSRRESEVVEFEATFEVERVERGGGTTIVRSVGVWRDLPGHDGKAIPMVFEYEFDAAGRAIGQRLTADGDRVFGVARQPVDDRSIVVTRSNMDAPGECVLDEQGRIVSARGLLDNRPWRLEWDDEGVNAFMDDTGELAVRMRLDEHGDPVDLRGPAGAIELRMKTPEEEEQGHSRRTYERDEHGNWTSMLIEYEREGGWEAFVVFEREITYWDE